MLESKANRAFYNILYNIKVSLNVNLNVSCKLFDSLLEPTILIVVKYGVYPTYKNKLFTRQ